MIATPFISMADDGVIRKDLSARKETKYVFARHDVALLRQVLLRSCRPIVYAGQVSTVRSVYFDSPRLEACHANLDGVGLRHKSRLRWYDQPHPWGNMFFEVKWRRHRVTGKHRMRLVCEQPPVDISFRRLHAELERVLPDGLGRHLARHTDAIVLVEYKREHFALRGSTARLTLDYDMRFYPQLGRQCLSHQFAQRLPGVALIECKSGVGDADALRGALTTLRARASRFSKYVTGCMQLGYATCE